MKNVEKSSSAGTEVDSSTNVDNTSVCQPIAKPNVGCSLSSNYDKRFPNSLRENFSQKELDDFMSSYSFVKVAHDYYELSAPRKGCSVILTMSENIASADLYTKNACQTLFNSIRITDIGDFVFLFEKNTTISILTSCQK